MPEVVYFKTWGQGGDGVGQFQRPNSISINAHGNITVSDTKNHRLQQFDANGRFITEIGGFGWHQDQFDHPMGLTAQTGLDIFVADHFNGRIVRYDKDLNYLAVFNSSEEWPDQLQFNFPRDVGITEQGEILVLGGENNRVLKLDIFGNPQLSFGDFDSGEGRLVGPQTLHVAGDGKIYISDTDVAQIVVFDPYGNFSYRFGGSHLKRPLGLAWHQSGILLVADGELKQVLFFHPTGGLLGSLGSQGLDHEFGEPVDVAVWRDRILVLDRFHEQIEEFRIVTDRKKELP